jgi:hypothetical protein
MTDQSTQNLAEIEGLLASRQQLTGWLERLDAAGSRAPEVVRAKVRGDYQGRLAQVLEQLRAYSDQVSSRLSGLSAQLSEFRQHRGEEAEIRAEAELRHSVGEYTDEEWQVIELGCSGKIASFDHEIERLGEEIRRMEEVQSLISGPASVPSFAPAPSPAPVAVSPPPVRPEPSPSAPYSEPELVVSHGPVEVEPTDFPSSDPLGDSMPRPLSLVRDEEVEATPAPARPEAPKFTPRGPAPKQRDSGAARSIPFPSPNQTPAPGDELAFLRSVSLDAAPPSARLTPHPAPNAAGMLDKEDRPSQTTVKTLKCGECGTLNRPTEWYCERCGAELAAL